MARTPKPKLTDTLPPMADNTPVTMDNPSPPADPLVPPIAVDPAVDAAGSPGGDTIASEPAETPAVPVIVTFWRPTPYDEERLRALMAEGKLATSVRTYKTLANAVLAEGAEPVTMETAQEAVHWLIAQAPIEHVEAAPEVETAADGTGEVVPFPSAPRPAPELRVYSRPAAEPVRQKLVATREINHAFRLTEDEKIEMGSELAAVVQGIAAERAEQAAAKREMKIRLDALIGDEARLAGIIAKGEEVRAVTVDVIEDYERGVIVEVIADTAIEISRREMAPGTQIPMFAPRVVEPVAVEASEADEHEEAGGDDEAGDEDDLGDEDEGDDE